MLPALAIEAQLEVQPLPAEQAQAEIGRHRLIVITDRGELVPLATPRSIRSSRLSLRRRASSARSSVVSPVLPFVRSARACLTHCARADGVRSNSRATAPTVLPSSRTSRTAPILNSSLNCRRARLPAFVDPILDIVAAFRNVSTKPDQAQRG